MNTAGTAALVADRRFAAVFGAVAVTGFAGFGRRNGYFFLNAAEGFFQTDAQIITHVFAALRIRALSAATAAAHKFGEHVGENVRKAARPEVEFKTVKRVAACAAGKGLMPVPVVCRPFLAVFQHVVSFVDFLEFGFGFLVARVAVRMIFHRQPPVRLLNGFAVGVAGNFQQFVIVFFSHFFCL